MRQSRVSNPSRWTKQIDFKKLKAWICMLSLESQRMQRRDIVMIVFGALDAIKFLLVLPQLFRMLSYLSYYAAQSDNLSLCISGVQCLLYISYPFSAYGFLLRKKWAFIFYYCQFPVRLAFFSVSLGFLSYINILFRSTVLHFILGIIMLLAEIARLVVTIILHRSNLR